LIRYYLTRHEGTLEEATSLLFVKLISETP